MQRGFEIIHDIEHEARTLYGNPGRGYVRRTVNGRTIECEIVSAMINRGMATGDAKRATWKLDGKRASRATIEAIARRAEPVEPVVRCPDCGVTVFASSDNYTGRCTGCEAKHL